VKDLQVYVVENINTMPWSVSWEYICHVANGTQCSKHLICWQPFITVTKKVVPITKDSICTSKWPGGGESIDKLFELKYYLGIDINLA